MDFLPVLLCGVDLVDHAGWNEGVRAALAEEHRGIGLFEGFHGVHVVHVEVVARFEDHVADVENREVGEFLAVKGGCHLAAHAGEAAVLHDEGEPWHFGCCLHGGCGSHGLAVDAPDCVFGEKLSDIGGQTDEVAAFEKAHGAVCVALAVAVEAVIVAYDIEAQFLVELSVGEHGDVVARPAVAEDYNASAAVGETDVLVGADDAAVELVTVFGLVSEFLDFVVFKGRERVEVAVLQDVLAC